MRLESSACQCSCLAMERMWDRIFEEAIKALRRSANENEQSLLKFAK